MGTGSVEGFRCCFSMLTLRPPNGEELECGAFSILITADVDVGLMSLLLFCFCCSCCSFSFKGCFGVFGVSSLLLLLLMVSGEAVAGLTSFCCCFLRGDFSTVMDVLDVREMLGVMFVVLGVRDELFGVFVTSESFDVFVSAVREFFGLLEIAISEASFDVFLETLFDVTSNTTGPLVVFVRGEDEKEDVTDKTALLLLFFSLTEFDESFESFLVLPFESTDLAALLPL